MILIPPACPRPHRALRLVVILALLLSGSLFAVPPPPNETLGRGGSDGSSALADVEAGRSKYSFLDPIGDFARDSIIQPKQPFEFVPGKDPNGWGFSIAPYLWLTSLNGTTGVGGFPAINVNARSKTLLQNLDWGIMGKAEIRKGRWGFLIDGYYAALSGSGDLQDPLYRSADLNLQQAFASFALAYRIIDDRRGFIDVYAGARYNYIGVQIDLETNPTGINQISTNLTNNLQADINARLTSILSRRPGILGAELARLIRAELGSRVLERISSRPKDLQNALGKSALRRILNSRRGALADFIAAQAAARAEAAKGAVSARTQNAVNSAKKKLSREIASKIEDELTTSGSGSEWWIDPLIGMRAQVNITRCFYLAAQGDVGGFGVGSQIVWNTQATIGINITRNLFTELGYRYMYVDYDKNGFLYNMNTYGIFASLGGRF